METIQKITPITRGYQGPTVPTSLGPTTESVLCRYTTSLQLGKGGGIFLRVWVSGQRVFVTMLATTYGSRIARQGTVTPSRPSFHLEATQGQLGMFEIWASGPLLFCSLKLRSGAEVLSLSWEHSVFIKTSFSKLNPSYKYFMVDVDYICAKVNWGGSHIWMHHLVCHGSFWLDALPQGLLFQLSNH